MTVAADRANATLLPHPALAFLGSDADGHSLAPVCPESSPLRILTDQQRAELDERGWTVLEGAFTTCTIDGLRLEVDRLEAELNPPDGPGLALGDAENVAVVDSGRLRTPSGATIRNISDARHITFSSRLADRSAAIRAFCGSEVFQRHDTLGARSVRLYNDEAVYKKPSGGGRGRSRAARHVSRARGLAVHAASRRRRCGDGDAVAASLSRCRGGGGAAAARWRRRRGGGAIRASHQRHRGISAAGTARWPFCP